MKKHNILIYLAAEVYLKQIIKVLSSLFENDVPNFLKIKRK